MKFTGPQWYAKFEKELDKLLEKIYKEEGEISSGFVKGVGLVTKAVRKASE